MKLYRLIFSLLGVLVGLLGMSRNANAGCSANLKDVVSGDRTLTIELMDHGQKKFAVDDDGYLVLLLIAAHCQEGVPWANVELNETQRKCQSEVETRVGAYFSDRACSSQTECEEKLKLNTEIAKSCGFDLAAKWKETREQILNAPLKCQETVKPIVARAVARAAQFSRENMTPEALARQNVPKDQIQQFIEQDALALDRARSFEKLLAATPLENWRFVGWTNGLSDVIKGHQYQMLAAPDAAPTADTLTDSATILARLGANLPGVARSRCGSFPTDLVEKLKDASWTPRSSTGGSGTGVRP